MPPRRADGAAQAVLDTRALDIAHEAKGEAARTASVIEMHIRQCDEREAKSSASRAAMHDKLDRLLRFVVRVLLTLAGTVILTLLSVVGFLGVWILDRLGGG